MLQHNQLLLGDLPSPPPPKRRRFACRTPESTSSAVSSPASAVSSPATPLSSTPSAVGSPTTPPVTPVRVPKSSAMTSDEAIEAGRQRMQLACTSELPCQCSLHMMKEARILFWGNTTKQQNDWLLRKMHCLRSSAGKQTLRFQLGYGHYCASCFRCILGINNKRWFKLRRMVKQGIVQSVHQYTKPAPRKTEAQVQVIQWLDSYVKAVGQFMPHVSEIHLPPGNWAMVYELCVTDLKAELGDDAAVCTASYFASIRKAHFPTVKVPPQQRFTKCKICTGLKAEKARTLIPSELKDIKQRHEKHLQQLMKERRKYWRRRRKARHNAEYLSIIIDGMDQHKTLLPRFMEQSSSMSRSLRLKAHIIGVIVHGRKNFVYISNDRIHSDPNLTIHCLLRTLLQLPRPLPKILYLQADNAFRENKNKFVFAFLGALVESGLFTKVCQKASWTVFNSLSRFCSPSSLLGILMKTLTRCSPEYLLL